MSSKVCRSEVWEALDSTSPSPSWPASQTPTNQRRPDSSCCASQTLAPSASRCASHYASTSSNALSPSDDTTSTTAISSSMDVGDGDATNTSVPCGRHGNPNASPGARATCNATTSSHSSARHLRSSTPKHDGAKGQLQCRHRGAGHGYDYPNECSDGCNWNVDLPHSDATESCSRANTTTKSLYT